jgi:hypothetical protein
MAESLSTVLGKFRGGPAGGLMRVTYDVKAGGVVKGEYKGKSGGVAGFEGKMVDKGKKVLGFWCVQCCTERPVQRRHVRAHGLLCGSVQPTPHHSPATPTHKKPQPRRYDYDQKITPGNRFECTCVITLEGAKGEVLKAKLRTKEGGFDEWEAKRWSEQDVARTEGKIASFCIKDAKVFERVTDNGRAKHDTWAEGARAKMMSDSVPRKMFDGAMTYIPGPATGDEYMTPHDLERVARAKEAGHRDGRIAMLEGKVAALEGKAAKGEDVKEKLEKARLLLKGEAAEKKMLEERADKKWKNGAGSFTPASSKHAEHMPDEYTTQFELARKLHKADLERPLKDKARMEAELPRVQAQLAKGEGNADFLKKREGFLQAMLAAKLPNKDDFKEFKPSSKTVTLASR